MSQIQELPQVESPPRTASKTMTPVLVLEVGHVAFHHVCIGVVRSLGRIGVPVYAVVEDRLTPAAISRYLSGAFVWNTHRLDSERLLNGMAAIGKHLGRPTLVIPTGDDAAMFIAEHADTLSRWFIFPQQPPALPRALANKRELYWMCKRSGVACPHSVFPQSIEEVHEYLKTATFPLVVKAADKWKFPNGVSTTSIAKTPEEACEIFRAAAGEGDANVIFQECIPLSEGEDWFYHGYRNAESGAGVGFTGKKLRSFPPFAGPTTLGKAIVNEPLRQQAEALLKSISYSGIVDLDFRLDKRDGQYKLLDFNPRVGAQFRLFENRAGVDVTRAMYLDLTGRRIPSCQPLEGRTFIAELNDLAASVGYYRQGELSLGDWWRSLKGKRELAWFCYDDPLPFFMMCARRLLRKTMSILGRKPLGEGTAIKPSYVKGFRGWFARRSETTRANSHALWVEKAD